MEVAYNINVNSKAHVAAVLQILVLIKTANDIFWIQSIKKKSQRK